MIWKTFKKTQVYKLFQKKVSKNNLKNKEKIEIIAFPKEKNENLIIKMCYVGHYSM